MVFSKYNNFSVGTLKEEIMKKILLSPTKIVTFLACRDKFKWTYLDKRGKWFLRAKHYYSFGTTLHRVLEKYHSEKYPEVKTAEQVLSDMEQNWLSAGYSCSQEMEEAMMEAREILTNYVTKQQERIRDAVPLYLEKQFKHEYDDFNLIGRVDRVDKHSDGMLEIIDYKTGRDTVSEEDVKEDVSMSIYQLLLRKLYPESKIMATIIAVKTGDEASYSLNTDEMNEFENDIKFIANEIFKFNPEKSEPEPKPLCENCDFKRLCIKYPSFVEKASLNGIKDKLLPGKQI